MCPIASCAAVSLTIIFQACYENINFVLLGFHAASSWLTAVRLIDDICIAIFGAFYLVPHTASTHAGIFRHMTDSTDSICGQIILLFGKFIHSMLGK